MRPSIRILTTLLPLAGCIDLPGDVVPDGAVDQAVEGPDQAPPADASGTDMNPPDGGPDTPCAERWPLLARLGPLVAYGQPAVADVDGDGYRDLLLPGVFDGTDGVRIGFGGPCGLARERRVETAGRPWRAVVGRFDGDILTLATLEQDPAGTWAMRGYPLDDPRDVSTWQIPPLGLAEESFIPERPLPMLAAPLDDQPGDELVFGSYYYLFSSLGPGLDVPRAVEPPGDAATYTAQDLAPLSDGRIFMLENDSWRAFEWSPALTRLDGGLAQAAPPSHRTMASTAGPEGTIIAGGFALESAQFVLFEESRGAVSQQPYRSERHPTSEVVGLAVGALRGRDALDVAALIRPPGGNPAQDESLLLACLDAAQGACSSWIEQPVAAPFPLLISGDFDSPIGTPSPTELLLLRVGTPSVDCVRVDRVELTDRFTPCD